MVLEFLRKYWKWVMMVALPILGFVLGATLHPQPAKVVTQEKIVYQDKVIYKDKIVTVEVEKVKVVYHTEKVKITAPDGTVTEKTVVDAKKDTDTKTDTTKTDTKKEYVDRVVEKVVTVTNERRFKGGLLFGVSPDILPIPKVNSFAIGAELDVRIVGPVWVGLWGMGTTKGQGLVGLSVGVEF